MTGEDASSPSAMADYAEVADVELGVMQLARRIDEFSHDEGELRQAGDAAAAARAARLLGVAMLQLAAVPAANPRQRSRKERALDAGRMAAAGLAPIGIEMIRAALDADLANLDLAAASAGPDAGPGPGKLNYYAREAEADRSFLHALSENEGLRHDCAYLLRRGEAGMARRLARRRDLDLGRTASRPAASLQEARIKVAFLESVRVERGPLSAMLDASIAFERAGWDIGPVKAVRTTPEHLPGEAERCAHYETLPDPADLEAWIAIGEQHYTDFDALSRRGDGARAAACFNLIVDLGLLVAAIPARHRAQVDPKLEFLASLRWDMRDQPLAAGLIDAAIRADCAKWRNLWVNATEWPGSR